MIYCITFDETCRIELEEANFVCLGKYIKYLCAVYDKDRRFITYF